MAENNKIFLIIIAILLPPVAVFMKKGAGKDLAINIVLCLLMWIPGVIHDRSFRSKKYQERLVFFCISGIFFVIWFVNLFNSN
jgi:uncharacterized membrane protein YqaE (UPF0057 family)